MAINNAALWVLGGVLLAPAAFKNFHEWLINIFLWQILSKMKKEIFLNEFWFIAAPNKSVACADFQSIKRIIWY